MGTIVIEEDNKMMNKENHTFEELVQMEAPFQALIIAPAGGMEIYRKRLADFFETHGVEWHLRNTPFGRVCLFNARTGAAIDLIPEYLCKIDNYLRGYRYDLIVMDWTTLVMGFQENYITRIFQTGVEIRLFSEVIK